jgi:hypothetical protein
VLDDGGLPGCKINGLFSRMLVGGVRCLLSRSSAESSPRWPMTLVGGGLFNIMREALLSVAQ